MKKSLLAGLFLLFITIIVLLLLTGGYALYMASGFSNSGIDVDSGSFIRILLHSIPILMPLALSCGFYITFLRLRHRPGLRPLTSLSLFITALALLWLSGTFLGTELSPDQIKITRNPSEYRMGVLTRIENGALIYRDKTEEGSFKGLYIDLDKNTKESLEIINAPPRMDEKNNAPLRLGAFPETKGYEAAIFTDFSLIGEMLVKSRASDPSTVFLISIAAFALYLTSCWGIIQISRWPLFNALTCLILLSGAGFFYRVFTVDIFQEFLVILEGRTLGIPPVVLTMVIAALLLILVDLLFIPYKRRLEES